MEIVDQSELTAEGIFDVGCSTVGELRYAGA